MTYLEMSSPIDDLVKPGIYGPHSHHAIDASHNHPPTYLLSYLKDISVVTIKLYQEVDIKQIEQVLKSMMGLMIPEPQKVYVSGMRKLMRPDARTLMITTEGEARGVLYERINYHCYQFGAIYDETASHVILRWDGHYLYHILSYLLTDLTALSSQIHSCMSLEIDQAQLIAHLGNVDTLYLYLQRSYAYALYGRIARLCLPYGLKII